MSATETASAGLVEVARSVAITAAQRSGVRIEAVRDLDKLEAVRRVIDEVWRPDQNDPPVTRNMLRALTHAGNYSALAYLGEQVVGTCVAFLGVEPADTLHSHIAGVTAAGAGRHIGFALKLDQRVWALERGIPRITWTFDPLVRRNAFFNMHKLGAVARKYAVDFYGDMSDAINAGQRTDRLVVTWDLAADSTVRACAGEAAEVDASQLLASGAEAILDEVDGQPIAMPGAAASSTRLVRVPADIEALRLSDPELAIQWRHAVRDALGGQLSDGWSVTGVSRDGYYVLARCAQANSAVHHTMHARMGCDLS
ncbi:MAG: GNAT family N-acetyltransferase [Actinomycetota bacterium]|nr:GNAT family N-acetyltransferase [Actinomycetota bacterium]